MTHTWNYYLLPIFVMIPAAVCCRAASFPVTRGEWTRRLRRWTGLRRRCLGRRSLSRLNTGGVDLSTNFATVLRLPGRLICTTHFRLQDCVPETRKHRPAWLDPRPWIGYDQSRMRRTSGRASNWCNPRLPRVDQL